MPFSFSSLTSSNMPSYFQPRSMKAPRYSCSDNDGGREMAAHQLHSTKPAVFSEVCLALVQRPGAGQKPVRDQQRDDVPPHFPEQQLLPHLLLRWVHLCNNPVFSPRPNSSTQSRWGLAFFKHFSLKVLVLPITVRSRHS